MRLEYLAFRNMIAKPMSLLFNILLLVLSISLVTFILQLSQQINGQLEKNIAPVDMVIGAKGSPLQLVLSSVLHIDSPTGNIPLSEAQKIQKHPFILQAIPLCYGDNYKGFRIVGTEEVFFQTYQTQLKEGRHFQQTLEIVAGHTVAKKLNLKIGDSFYSSHGLIASTTDVHKENQFIVVGILAPTATVADQLLLSNMESIWDSHDYGKTESKTKNRDSTEQAHQTHEDHAHEDEDHHEDDHGHGHEEEHEHETEEHHDHSAEEHPAIDREITALLVKFKNPLGLVQLPRFINEKTNMQAALPRLEIQRLESFLGVGVKTVNSIALAVLFVSGLSILLSLARAIRERRQELALLRTYGLATKKLLYIVLLEGLFLTVIGYTLGWLFGRISLFLVSVQLESSFGYSLEINGPQMIDLQLFIATLLIAFVATCIASTSLFNLNISKTLSDE